MQADRSVPPLGEAGRPEFLIASAAFVAAALLAFTLTTQSSAAPAAHEIPPAFGPCVNPKPADFAEATSFRGTDRIVGTYYFYWYDGPSRSHLIDGDGTDALTTHPPTLEGLSWKSVAWHRRQLEDMMAAGIDVVLPVFWGAPSEQSTKAHLPSRSSSPGGCRGWRARCRGASRPTAWSRGAVRWG
jgi:hypothetical protein